MMIKSPLRRIKNRTNVNDNVTLIKQLLISCSNQYMILELRQFLEKINREELVAMEGSYKNTSEISKKIRLPANFNKPE